MKISRTPGISVTSLIIWLSSGIVAEESVCTAHYETGFWLFVDGRGEWLFARTGAAVLMIASGE